jgi:CDP-diacylglycerol--glycerol-3-phosphate 3-phosphatidyltransferase
VRKLKTLVRSAADPLAAGLVALGVSANALTVTGFLLNLISGAVAAAGALTLAGILYLLFNCLDFLDGAVARRSGTVGPFGAFLDSVLDRASEAAILVGLVYLYASQQQAVLAVLAGAALTGSFLVSYARARAEGLGLDCEVGWVQRPERIVLLGLGLIFSWLNPWVMPLVLGFLTLATAVTTVQRVAHVARLTHGGGSPAAQR